MLDMSIVFQEQKRKISGKHLQLYRMSQTICQYGLFLLFSTGKTAIDFYKDKQNRKTFMKRVHRWNVSFEI